MTRQVNAAGLALARTFETLVPYSYDDVFFPPRPSHVGDVIHGTITIGYGHTGSDVHAGQTASTEEIEAWFKADMERAADVVERELVKADWQAEEIADNEFAALADFVFSVGAGHFENSTLLRDLLADDLADVPGQIARWDWAGGRKLVGLDRRRAAEIALWNTPDAPVEPTYEPTTV